MAKQGDPTALRLCMERILPARKSAPVRFKLPRIRSVADLVGAMDSIMQAIAKGRITPGEGQQILAQLESIRRIFETEERLRPQVEPTYCGKLSQIADRKVRQYVENGAPEVWLLYGRTASVSVYRGKTAIEIEGTLTSELLPGVSIDLSVVFGPSESRP
jgi:hypothetical protein